MVHISNNNFLNLSLRYDNEKTKNGFVFCLLNLTKADNMWKGVYNFELRCIVLFDIVAVSSFIHE